MRVLAGLLVLDAIARIQIEHVSRAQGFGCWENTLVIDSLYIYSKYPEWSMRYFLADLLVDS